MLQKKLFIAVLTSSLMLLAILCKRGGSLQGVDLEVTFSDSPLTDNLITELQLKWMTGEDFQDIGRDLYVYVHFWHAHNLLFQADYSPEIPTSQWQPNQEYQNSQRIFIPAFIDEFDPEFNEYESMRLSIGLYSPHDRSGNGKYPVLERELKIYPVPPDAPEIIYLEGWYDLEQNPDTFLKSWRWTQKEAICLMDNPHRDAVLIINGAVNRGVFQDQKITFFINDTLLDEFIPAERYFDKTYQIEKDEFGELDEYLLKIIADKSFIPEKHVAGSQDKRELGIVISLIYFR